MLRMNPIQTVSSSMQHFIRKSLLLIGMISTLSGVGVAGIAHPAHAVSKCGGVETALLSCKQDNKGANVKDNAIWAILIIILNILTAGVGILAVAGIVYGSILYTTAEDKADQVKKATDIITNVIIGLVAYALMWSFLNFIIPGGIFA